MQSSLTFLCLLAGPKGRRKRKEKENANNKFSPDKKGAVEKKVEKMEASLAPLCQVYKCLFDGVVLHRTTTDDGAGVVAGGASQAAPTDGATLLALLSVIENETFAPAHEGLPSSERDHDEDPSDAAEEEGEKGKELDLGEVHEIKLDDDGATGADNASGEPSSPPSPRGKDSAEDRSRRLVVGKTPPFGVELGSPC